jgi:hypothetical protein
MTSTGFVKYMPMEFVRKVRDLKKCHEWKFRPVRNFFLYIATHLLREADFDGQTRSKKLFLQRQVSKGGHGTENSRGSLCYSTFLYGRYGAVMANWPDCKVRYRQPGLLCTSRNFAQIQKMLGTKYFLVLRLPLRHFQNLKTTRVHDYTQTKLRTC